MNFRSQNSRRDVVLDLTPMIDVVFLLLIFFLVTATFAQQDRSMIPIELPEGSTGQASEASDRVTLVVAADGSVTVTQPGGETVETATWGELEEVLTELYQEDPDVPVRLRGDLDVPYGRVMEVWDMARSVGFRRVENEIHLRE